MDCVEQLRAPAFSVEREVDRLLALRAYRVLDTAPEEAFDEIAALAADLCGTPIALISLVDESRQWFKARVGIDAIETARDIAFCAHAIHGAEPMVVPDATADPRFADNPLVTSDPNIRFYAGAPLVTPSGAPIGTLCVIDTVARDLEPRALKLLAMLANQVVLHLEQRATTLRLRESVDRLEAAEEALRFQATHDPLTGLPNRALFFGLLEERMQSGGDLSVFYLDLTSFKLINDTYGHSIGDEVLIEVGRSLMACTRGGDLAARLGGDEFALVASMGAADCAAMLDRLHAAVVRTLEVDGHTLTIDCSFGVATRGPADTVESLLFRADHNMYISKRAVAQPTR